MKSTRKFTTVLTILLLASIGVASTTPLQNRQRLQSLQAKPTTMKLPLVGEIGKGKAVKVLLADDNCYIFHMIAVYGVVVFSWAVKAPCSGGGQGGGGGSAF